MGKLQPLKYILTLRIEVLLLSKARDARYLQ